MSIVSRFVNVVRSQLNALLNRAEDPSKLLDQTLIDMRSAFGKAKEQVAHAVADQTRLERDLSQQRQEIERWSQNAVKAVEQGNDTLAKEALRRKNEHTRFAAQYEHELVAQRSNVDRLKDSLRELEDKIEELGRKKNLLKSRQKRAEAQDSIYRTLEGIDNAGAMDTINRMEEKIDEMSALADARQSLAGEFQGDDVERQFRELENQGGDVDAELLELKQRMQIENKG